MCIAKFFVRALLTKFVCRIFSTIKHTDRVYVIVIPGICMYIVLFMYNTGLKPIASYSELQPSLYAVFNHV